MDGLGRTIKLETGPGNTPNGSPTSVVDTLYAACGCTPLGKMNAVSRPHAPGATAYFTYYSYDPAGRTIAVAEGATESKPNGSGVSTVSYAGNTIRSTDAAGQWKQSTSHAFGNLVTLTEPEPAGRVACGGPCMKCGCRAMA